MYAIDDSDIKNGIISFSERCIRDFSDENGYLVLLDFTLFERMLATIQTNGYELDAGKVSYRIITPEDSSVLFNSDGPRNLFIKHPYFSYQKEFRIVITKQAYKYGEPMIDHVKYHFPSSLENIATIVGISELEKKFENYVLDIKKLWAKQEGMDATNIKVF